MPTPRHGITVGAILLQPRSTGTVSPRSADPVAKPLSTRATSLTPTARSPHPAGGMRVCEDLLATPALRAVTDGAYVVPEGAEALDPALPAEQIVGGYAHTHQHPTSTARMGTDEGSVVDPELRIRGVEGPRLADASVMPQIVRGHTNAALIVIGERAAELIDTHS